MNEHAIDAELELRRRHKANENLVAPEAWQPWCYEIFPNTYKGEFGDHHKQMWDWSDKIELGVKPEVSTLMAFLARGGGKSANVEGILVRLGARKKRKYVWYVSSTQDKADTHVAAVGSMMEKDNFARYYQKMSQRATNKYGSSKGWRRERLHARNGFVIDALGLDTGARGMRIEDMRPDLIIFDDIDEKEDTPNTTLKKMRTITETILPSGSVDCAIIFVQNLVAPDSIASRLADGRADFMRNRLMIGPLPAIKNLVYEEIPAKEIGQKTKYKITGGEITWAGQDIETCEAQMNDWGPTAFLREAQHDVNRSGGIWDTITFIHKTWPEIEDKLIRVVVWIDPAVTSTDNSDCQGISCGATIGSGFMIGLYFWEGIQTPHATLKQGIYVGLRYGAESVGIETDNGGDVWKSAYTLACQEVAKELTEKWKIENPDKHIDEMPDIILPKFKADKAGHGHGSKIERNARMLTDYEKGLVYHLSGMHTMIEKSLYRFPTPPLDLADSWYYCWYDLIGRKKPKLAH